MSQLTHLIALGPTIAILPLSARAKQSREAKAHISIQLYTCLPRR